MLHINIIIIMWWGPKHQLCPWIPSCEVKYWPWLQFDRQNSNTACALKARSVTFFSNDHCLLIVGSATAFSPCSMCSSTMSLLCHSGGEAMPEVKSEKEKFPRSFLKQDFVATSSLLSRNTWTRDPSFLDLPSTSPTIYSTIPIFLRPIKPGSYPMVERGEKLCCWIEILA